MTVFVGAAEESLSASVGRPVYVLPRCLPPLQFLFLARITVLSQGLGTTKKTTRRHLSQGRMVASEDSGVYSRLSR